MIICTTNGAVKNIFNVKVIISQIIEKILIKRNCPLFIHSQIFQYNDTNNSMNFIRRTNFLI